MRRAGLVAWSVAERDAECDVEGVGQSGAGDDMQRKHDPLVQRPYLEQAQAAWQCSRGRTGLGLSDRSSVTNGVQASCVAPVEVSASLYVLLHPSEESYRAPGQVLSISSPQSPTSGDEAQLPVEGPQR